MRRSFVVVAVALPLLAIGLGIVRAELTFVRTQEFRFEITGYDPRDLFRGHYLQFRLKLEPSQDRCTVAADSCCFCLSEQPDKALPRIERTTCSEARDCDAWLSPELAQAPFRFYVSDVAAPELERRLLDGVQRKGATARMAVDAKGRAHVRALYVDGQELVPAR